MFTILNLGTGGQFSPNRGYFGSRGNINNRGSFGNIGFGGGGFGNVGYSGGWLFLIWNWKI